MVGEEPCNLLAAIAVAGRVASLISIVTVYCWIRSTNNTFFISFFFVVIAPHIICFFMRASKRPVPEIFLDVLRIALIGVALVVVLWEAGTAAGELFIGSAVLTVVLGFALRDTLGNVVAGLAIHACHPFEVDDLIQYDTNAAHVGKIIEINWRAAKVITLDLASVSIPNSQLTQASIRNFTKPDPWSRRILFIVAPYEDTSPKSTYNYAGGGPR